MYFEACARLYIGKVLFLCENNRYATFSDQLKRQSEDNISERVNAFGVRSIQIFGNDVVWLTKQ